MRVNTPSHPGGPPGARTALRTQLRETVRAAILDAAEELIAARGLHGAPLAEIAKQAGVAVGTLYNYFADRDALIRALFESRRETLYPQILAAISGGRELPFEPRLRQLVRGVLAAFASYARYVKVMIETEHVKLSTSTTVHDIQTALEEVAQAGVREGVLGADQAALFAMLLAAGIRSLVLRRTADDGDLTARGDALVSILLEGARRR